MQVRAISNLLLLLGLATCASQSKAQTTTNTTTTSASSSQTTASLKKIHKCNPEPGPAIISQCANPQKGLNFDTCLTTNEKINVMMKERESLRNEMIGLQYWMIMLLCSFLAAIAASLAFFAKKDNNTLPDDQHNGTNQPVYMNNHWLNKVLGWIIGIQLSSSRLSRDMGMFITSQVLVFLSFVFVLILCNLTVHAGYILALENNINNLAGIPLVYWESVVTNNFINSWSSLFFIVAIATASMGAWIIVIWFALMHSSRRAKIILVVETFIVLGLLGGSTRQTQSVAAHCKASSSASMQLITNK